MGVFNNVGESLDSWSGAYVTAVSAGLSVQLVPLAGAGLSLWLLIFGTRILTGQVGDPIAELLRRFITISIVFTIALSAGVYQDVIVPAVHGLTDGLAGAILSSAGRDPSSASASIYQQLDDYDGMVDKVVVGYLKESLLNFAQWDFGVGLMQLFAAVLLSFTAVIMLIVLGLEVMFGRVALALLLGLGPFFILCSVFEATSKFFTAWVQGCVTWIALQVLIVAMLALTLAVFGAQLEHTYFPAGVREHTDGAAQAVLVVYGGNFNAVLDAFKLCLAAILLALLALGIPIVAAQLGGGAAVSGVAAFVGAATGRAITMGMGPAVKAMSTKFSRAAVGHVSNGLGGVARAARGVGSLGDRLRSGGGGSGGGQGAAYQRAAHARLSNASVPKLALPAPGGDAPPAPVYEADSTGYLRPVHPPAADSGGSSAGGRRGAPPPAPSAPAASPAAAPGAGDGPAPSGHDKPKLSKRQKRARAATVARIINERGGKK
jgi:type IV secretion system protein VirB6